MQSNSSDTSVSSQLTRLLSRAEELFAQGLYADAIPPLAEAASLRPDSPGIQANLGGLYVETGRYRQALEPLRRALSLNPGIAIAHWRLGTALQALADTDSAVAAYEMDVEIRPALSDAHARLGMLYMSRGRTREAVASCRKAAETATEPGEKLFLEAQALIYDERELEAESLLRSALELQPDLPTAHGLPVAQVLVSAGRFDEAGPRIYEAQLARTPRASLCYYDLVRSRKISETDGHILELIESALGQQDLDDINRSVLLLARGKSGA